MEQKLAQLVFALRFCTRLPIPGSHEYDGDLADAAILFPFVGAIIGLLVGMVWWLANLFFPGLSAAGIAIGFGILLTGALHEDGLSDCADGLGGGQTRERALEIMRDSRIGAYGAAALVMTIGLRWTALAALDRIFGLAALVIAHMASRSAIVIALATATYARDNGLASSVAAGVNKQVLVLLLAGCAVVSFLIDGFAGIIAALSAFVGAWLFLIKLKSRLGGYTGDGLGAMQQIAEITVLLVLAGFWSS